MSLYSSSCIWQHPRLKSFPTQSSSMNTQSKGSFHIWTCLIWKREGGRSQDAIMLGRGSGMGSCTTTLHGKSRGGGLEAIWWEHLVPSPHVTLPLSCYHRVTLRIYVSALQKSSNATSQHLSTPTFQFCFMDAGQTEKAHCSESKKLRSTPGFSRFSCS